jgi:hypothetical protein
MMNGEHCVNSELYDVYCTFKLILTRILNKEHQIIWMFGVEQETLDEYEYGQ